MNYKSIDIQELIAKANNGDVWAIRCLGLRYFYGHGVPQNYDDAFKCFTEADDKEMLGECYLHGLGVERNVNKTIELWETACAKTCRNYYVIFKLGSLYGDGIEREPDYEKALYWWSQLAENDSGEFAQEGAFPEAIYQLALYYYEGKGVKRNLKHALKLFKYTIDLFSAARVTDGEMRYVEYDREQHAVNFNCKKIKGNITISDEPDFIIHSRKILVKHGYKSMINTIKNAAEQGDEKAAEILEEAGIEFITLQYSAPIPNEIADEPITKESSKREPPIDVIVGESVSHKTFGDGIVCESNDGYICVEFTVGKKKFLNPEAFNDGFLKRSL